MNPKGLLFCMFFLFIVNHTFSQSFGNEWIVYGQPYVKFSVHQQGMHRVTYSSLLAAGLPAGVSGQSLQLFRDGQEQRLWVSNNGVLSASDYIEFWGEKADGRLDRRLYQDTSMQLNPALSLVSDTAYYFITVNTTTSHLRFQQQVNTIQTPWNPEAYMWRTIRNDYRAEFNPGESAAEGQYQSPELLNLNLSQYQQEGYVKRFTTNTDSIIFQLPGVYTQAGAPAISLHTAAVGRSYTSHQLRIFANNILQADSGFQRFDIKRYQLSFPVSIVDANNTLKISYQNTGIPGDRYGISYAALRYPASFSAHNQSSLYVELDPKPTAYQLVFTNVLSAGQPVQLVDLTRGALYTADTSVMGELRFQLPASIQPLQLVLQGTQAAAYKSVTAVKTVQLRNYTQALNQGDYIILTDLRYTQGAQGVNPVQAYSDYRKSALGGSFSTTIAYTHELYDEFGYGYDFSTLALRNFLHYAHSSASWVQKPKHLFIIGRGLEYNSYLAYRASSFNSYPYFAVPTFGQPGSDLLLSDFGKNDKPQISTGRLSAFNAVDVSVYLEKVKEYENVKRSTNVPASSKMWMKNVLHIAGATDSIQKIPIVSALQRQKTIIENPNFGGQAKIVVKSTNGEQEIQNSNTIDTLMNGGAGLVQFFGHSSASTIDYGLDFPERYTNDKKYNLIMANGCGAGNIFLFTGQRYLSERFVFAPQTGSIGFLASVNTGFSGYLGFYTDSLYARFSKLMYGKSVGEQMINNVNALISLPNFQTDFLLKMHTEQLLLNGDPAISLYSPSLPDYAVELSHVQYTPSLIHTATDSISFTATFINAGRATTDSVDLFVRRIMPNGVAKTVFFKRVPAFSYQTVQHFKVPVMGTLAEGNNQFQIHIDPQNKIQELSETNNSVSINIPITALGVEPIYPAAFSIVNQYPFVLKATTFDPFAPSATYVIQIDTTELFNSPLLRSTLVNSSGGVLQWQADIAALDSTVFYWRTALDVADPLWRTSSFIYLPLSSPGWNQSHYYQFTKDRYQSVDLDSATRSFSFENERRTLQVQNVCMNGPAPFTYIWPEYLVKINGSTLYTFGCDPWPGYSSLQFVVIDSLTGNPWLNTRPDPAVALGRFGSFDPCRITNGAIKEDPFFEFSFLNTASRKNIMDFLDSIPQGYYVMIQPRLCVGASCGTINNVFVNQWKSDTTSMGSGVSLYHKLKNFGFNTIDSLYRNRPMILWMRKGEASSIRQHVGADITVKLFGEFEYTIKKQEGTIQSTIIGPASAWQNFVEKYSSVEPINTDATSYSIFGVRPGSPDVFISKVMGDTSLSYINAAQYPYLRLEMNSADVANRTPSQLQHWRVHYTPLPEAAISLNQRYDVENIDATHRKKITFAIQNLAGIAMDSLLISYTIFNANYTPEATYYQRVKPLPIGDSIHVSYEIDLDGFYSSQFLEIMVNPLLDQPEQFLPNNLAIRSLALIDPSLPLPVNLHQFVVMPNGCAAKLSWITQEEQNFKGFDIERKWKEAQYKKIAHIKAEGGEEAHTYQWLDAEEGSGTRQYRLRMIDIDGKFSYSPDASIRLLCELTGNTLRLYPNPTSDIAKLHIPAGNIEDIHIEIISATGQKVYSRLLEFDGNAQEIELPFSTMASGLYHVKVRSFEYTQVFSLLKD